MMRSLSWSFFQLEQHPELSVASYSRNELSDSPDGLVLVWNMHLSDRPEFVFHAQVRTRAWAETAFCCFPDSKSFSLSLFKSLRPMFFP